MFAVPGWSLSAPLVPEPSQKASHANDNKKSKKRKRNDDSSDTKTPAQDPTPATEVKSHRTRTLSSEPAESSQVSAKAGQPPQRKKSFRSDGRHENIGRTREKQKESLAKATTLQEGNKENKIAPRHSAEGGQISKQSIVKRHVAADADAVATSTHMVDRSPKPLSSTSNLTPLQAKMRNKLTSARFRHLNETLYTTSSSEALDLFTKSPDLFAEYHAGFAQQVKDSWPQNPVEGYVKAIKTRGACTNPREGIMPLPRRKTGSCTIADLGCGDAPLARGCQSKVKALMLKFHNYDLHTPNTFVTKADISNLPLRDGEADIAVFCLSLMGTNWIAFVEEAWRVLRGDGKGEVWVAEVKSRFGRTSKGKVVENSVGKRRKTPKSHDNDQHDGPEQFVEDTRIVDQADDETDLTAFIKIFTRRGFQLREGSVNKNNKMFVTMLFTKSGIPTAGKHKGLKWIGKEYVRQDGMNKMRFANNKSASRIDEEDITVDEEAKALKPCVYKTR